MGIVGIVCGFLGLLSVALSPWEGVLRLVLGVALGTAAVVLGAIDRKDTTGKASLAFGLLDLAGAVGLILCFGTM